MANYDYERRLFSYLENIRSYVVTRPMVLGGVSGALGGSGGPPGGYIGVLPQYRVAFDSTEAETWEIPPSGTSLLTNLNRMRYRISVLEASGVGGSSVVDIYGNGVSKGTAHELDFIGGTVTVAANRATITFSGGGGTLTQEQIEDYIGGMVSGNTETGIAVTYDDGTGKLNFDASHNHTGTYALLANGVTNGDSHDHIGGDGAAISEGALSLSDVTTNNSSTSKHGLLPRLDNVSTHYLNGQGNWAIPSGTGGGSSAFHGCRVYLSSNQSIPAGNDDAIAFNVAEFDTDAFHSGSNTYITIPTGLGGKYIVTANFGINNGGNYVLYEMTVVDSSAYVRVRENFSAFPNFSYYQGTSNILTLEEGETLTMKVHNSDSSARNVLGNTNQDTSLCLYYLGE